MRKLGFPSLRHNTPSVFYGAQKTILQDLYLSSSLGITLACKTVTKDSIVVGIAISLIQLSKTVSKSSLLTNFANGFSVTSKTVTKNSSVVNLASGLIISSSSITKNEINLSNALGIIALAKTISNCSATTNQALSVVAGTKTITLDVLVPNFALSLIFASKVISFCDIIVQQELPGTLGFIAHSKTITKSSAVVDFVAPQGALTLSSTTITRSNVVVRLFTTAQRISRAKIALVTKMPVIIQEPIFRQ